MFFQLGVESVHGLMNRVMVWQIERLDFIGRKAVFLKILRILSDMFDSIYRV